MRAVVNARQTILENLPKGSVGAEIGVFQGDFSDMILRVVAPAKLYLVDPWLSFADETHRKSIYGADSRSQQQMDAIADRVATRFAGHIREERVQICRETASAAFPRLPDGHLDWTYIDGDHSYDGVSEDLRLSYQKVKNGGYITGDDYHIGNWFADGVVRAVHDFLAEMRSKVVVAFILDAQFALRKRT